MPSPILKDEAKVYSCGDCYIIPYPSPSLVATCFLRMEQEKLLDTVWHEKVPDVGWFINEFTKKSVMLTCWVKTKNTGVITDDLELAGFTWFNAAWKIGRFDLNRAETGICFFRKFWRRKWTLTLAAMSADWAFDNLNVYAMFGTTPVPNKAACAFFRSLGWASVGPVPNFTSFPGIEEPVGVYLSFTSKPEWAEARKRWFV